MVDLNPQRPFGIKALVGFFVLASLMALVAALSLATPGGPLEPMWSINPRGHAAFASMGPAAIVVLGAVSLACGITSLGLFRARPWARWLATAVLGANGVGDLVALARGDLRTLMALPIVSALLVYLWSKKTAPYLSSDARARRRP